MNRNDVERLLEGFEGATFAALDTVTIPTLKGGKGNPFQGRVIKKTRNSRVMLFTNKNSSGYENKVKRHLEKAGKNPESFVMGALPWGQRLPNSPLIENKGKYYLQCVFLHSGESLFEATESITDENGFFFATGETIPREAIQGLNEKTGSEHQGLERDSQVIVRTYALDSIVSLRAMGDEIH